MLLLLGLSISLDELAIGFGLLHLPMLAALGLIAAQAFLVAQFGLRLGARVGETDLGVDRQLGSRAWGTRA